MESNVRDMRVQLFILGDDPPGWLIAVVCALAGLLLGILLAAARHRRDAASRADGVAQALALSQPVDGRSAPNVAGADFPPLNLRALGDDFFSRIVAQTTSDGLVVQRLDGRILWVNDAYCALMGLDRRLMIGRNPLEFCLPPHLRPPPAEIAAFRYDPTDPSTRGLHLRENRRADGTPIWLQISVTFRQTPDGRIFAVLVCRDATQQVTRQNEIEDARARLEHLASHDTLTGLPNRAALMAFTRDASAGDGDFGLIRIDLDHFKGVNDSHGHAAGDAVLIEVARRMRTAVRADDMAARTGGDEFVVVCPALRSLDDLRGIAAAVSAAVNGPFVWEGRTVQIGASIGAVLSDATTTDPDEMLLRSDFALYAVKDRGRGAVALFDDGLHRRYREQQHLSDRLTRAVAEGHLTYLYQPIIGLSRGGTIGVDVVPSWTDGAHGVVAPEVFLPLAGRLGLMVDIGFGAIAAAIAAKQAINTLPHHAESRVDFAAAPELLTCPDFVDRLIAAVEGAGLRRQDIPVEVVETVIVGPGATAAAAVFNELKAAGFKTVLDNFGTGYAGLASLSGLDIAGVKIAPAMAADIATDANSARIVETIVALCVSLDIFVIVKGVETEAQVACLRAMRAYVMQGDAFAPPMPLDTLMDWLRTRDGVANHPLLARHVVADRHSGSPEPRSAASLRQVG